jgi:tetratricopeptide (TPR) repeat protein
MRFLIIVIIFLYAALALYSDDEIAGVYVKKAQDLAKKKEYKEALTSFRKAINESPELPDTYVALGEMYRDVGESEDATTNFQKALAIIQSKEPNPKLKSLQSKVESYLSEYAKLRQELAKINEQFLKSLLPLMDKYETEDPELALMISERILRLEPANETALSKKKELSRRLSDAKKQGMTALFNGDDLDDWETSEGWSVKENCIRFELSESNVVSAAAHKTKLSGDYNIVAQVKLDGVSGQSNILAVSFGFQSLSACYAFGFFDNKLALAMQSRKEDGRFQRLKEKELGNIDVADWNELEVEVYGRAVRFYLNGELCFEMTAPDKESLSGNTALIGNNCAGWFRDVLYAADE